MEMIGNEGAWKVLKHDGSQHHFVGFQPDYPAERTIQGVKDGKDEVLEKAIEIARRGTQPFSNEPHGVVAFDFTGLAIAAAQWSTSSKPIVDISLCFILAGYALDIQTAGFNILLNE
jgi:hypothetical protein